MDIMTLMAQFADPQNLHNLSTSQKLTASLITTLLGMGITFISLVILQVVIGLMARFTARNEPPPVAVAPAPAREARSEEKSDPEELVAAITAALAMQLGTSANSIVIRNIHKVEDHSTVWSRAGLAELMNNNG